MATLYNTNNPLGSTSPKDLSDNAVHFDEAMNDISPSFTDRFGRRRETWSGMEAMFSDLLMNLGFEPIHLTYVDGTPLQVQRPTQLIDRAGLTYRVKLPASFPVNLTGTWATDLLQLVEQDQAALLRSDLAADDGWSMIGAYDGLTVKDVIERGRSQNEMSPFMFGAKGDGLTDDTLAINQCAIAMLANGVRFMDLTGGNFRASHLDWNGFNGVTIRGAGAITGMDTGAYESVLTVRNSVDFNIEGRIVVSASYNSDYECAVAMYDDTGAGFAKNSLRGLHYHGAKIGLRIGSTAQPTALVSESTIFGGYTYGVPCCVEIIGTQTVYSFIGFHKISGVEGVPPSKIAEWANFPRIIIRSFGASVNSIGGSAHITDVDTGLGVDMRPLQVGTVRTWGVVGFDFESIECASEFCRIWDPENTPGSAVNINIGNGTYTYGGSGGLQLNGNTGFHSGNAREFIVAYDYVPETLAIALGDNPHLFAAVLRTMLTVNAGASKIQIHANEASFGRNFPLGFAGISGGTLHFSHRKVFEVNNLAAQGIPAATTTSLKFTSRPSTNFNNRFGNQYNTSTGVFTAPAGGLKSVQVQLYCDIGASRPGSNINVTVNRFGGGGTEVRSYVGTEAGRYVSASLEIGDMNAGDNFLINFVAAGATSTFNFGSTSQDHLVVSAAV